MSGCKVYPIKPLEKYETSFEKLIKKHYRKNQRARNSFEELMNSFIDILRNNPSSNDISDDEDYPKGCYQPEFCFRKIRFKMPELQGASRYGRLMYVIHEVRQVVYLVWVYTHEEFEKRPSDNDLKSEFAVIQQDIEQN